MHCRQESLLAVSVESPWIEASGKLEFVQDQFGNQVSRQDEENVDADISTGKPGEVRMGCYDEPHGEGSHALDVGRDPEYWVVNDLDW